MSRRTLSNIPNENTGKQLALSRAMKKAAILILLLSNFAYAKNCPTEEQESISVCRAEKECSGGSGHKIALAFGMMLGGMGSGMSRRPNSAAENYNSCIDRNLDAQKYNANLKIYAETLKQEQAFLDEAKNKNAVSTQK